MSVATHPTMPLVYIGIQRGGKLRGRSYAGGNSFLAVYDLDKREYVAEVNLAEIINQRSDNSTPCSLLVDRDCDVLLVGMFQSRLGITSI